ncbi:MAG: sigma-70 family RNA polymerase sigma factor [Kiritimatiellae bacterium]|nr:sigma-70 family RNA polymerase sigma factor [Kiritimatiellia bacterium]
MDTQDDAVLVKRAQTADRVAFDELIRRYQGKIYGLIYNMTSNNADTEDLVQEVFIKAYKSLGRFKGKARFYTWLYRIGVNQTLNFLKKRQRRSALSLDDIDLGIERDPAYIELTESKPSPLRNTSISELQERLNKALQTLSEKHRTVVVLHDIQGLPHDEVAKMLKTSSGTVRSRLFYARQKLQAELAEFRR